MPPNYSQYQLLTALDVISASDVWAAGYYSTNNGYSHLEFVHFDGAQWTAVKVSTPNLVEAAISGIAHFASNDVWAVGSAIVNGLLVPITMHWDGLKWKVIPNAAGQSNGELLSVVRVGRSLYAAGYTYPIEPLVERFDGRKWVSDNSYIPPSGQDSILQGVGGTAPDDVWAGGYYGHGAFVEHKNARTKSWVQVAVDFAGYVISMSARSGREVWALTDNSLIVYRWNGKTWKGVQFPGVSYPTWIDATASTGYVWLVGLNDRGSAQFTTVIYRYIRGQWEQSPVVQFGSWGTAADVIAPVPGSADVWAVGHYSDTGPLQSYNLAELWNCPSGAQ